jgi:tRNA (guanine-N7-)-methyltransferase
VGAARSRRRAAPGVLSSHSETGQRRFVYGRRRGRKLRPGQQELWRRLLPTLRVALPPPGTLAPATLFDRPVEAVWLEIGFGAGEHLAAQAAAHAAVGFIGCEVFENGVAKLLAEIEQHRLANIRLFLDDARLLLASLSEASLARVFILFPDPWPKLRHHKRRIVSRATLDALARVMADGAELRLATDDRGYLAWMLEHVTAHPDFEWLAQRPADWRERPADWPATRYEQKAIAAGRMPTFLRFRRRPRVALPLVHPSRGSG